MLHFENGQTYICTKSGVDWWTEGKEYTVELNRLGTELGILDDDGITFWYDYELNELEHTFKLKNNKTIEINLFVEIINH